MADLEPIRLGISQCLLGDPVRYDGGHRRHAFLADVLSRRVEWVPVCPEVEAGLGTPREPMLLIAPVGHPKLYTVDTRQDKTTLLNRLSIRRVRELKSLNLCGYVFKARSPSCGLNTVSVHDQHGRPITTQGSGLFAQSFHRHFPLIPITDEGEFDDQRSRDHFLAQVFGYHRWQTFLSGTVTRHTIGLFHSAETHDLQRHSPRHFSALTRLVSRAGHMHPKQLAHRYGVLFMSTMAFPPPPEAPHTFSSGNATHHHHKAGSL
ncbi:MAG: DUF523 and DUF1722 domain-containing protein [Nitrospira sp.]|nr:DUF523 and DUF1722 domain-containing protein [Nitrospira sp.]